MGSPLSTASGETLPAQADAEKCQRILLNLLSNAFKFTPAGGAVGLSLRREEGSAVIEVEDTGPGVPMDKREAVFERFRQVEGGAERLHGGTGLGLAIVKELVELHDGTMEISDAFDGGALFTIALPMSAPVGAEVHATPTVLDQEIDRQMLDELHGPAAETALPATAPSDAPLVLVVEDNSDMNAYVAEALGTLAGGVAHDFNNILGIILGYTEMVRWDMDEGSDEDARGLPAVHR